MRFFVEGLALAALTFLITLKPFGNLPDMPLRITVTLLVCMGPFLLGTIGIGGEPITVAITGFFKWLGQPQSHALQRKRTGHNSRTRRHLH